jgi:hypothetical protein
MCNIRSGKLYRMGKWKWTMGMDEWECKKEKIY